MVRTVYCALLESPANHQPDRVSARHAQALRRPRVLLFLLSILLTMLPVQRVVLRVVSQGHNCRSYARSSLRSPLENVADSPRCFPSSCLFLLLIFFAITMLLTARSSACSRPGPARTGSANAFGVFTDA